MPDFIKEMMTKYKIDDNKILIVGIILLLIPILFLLSFQLREKGIRTGGRIETEGISKQSAFNLTARSISGSPSAYSSSGGAGSGSSGSGVRSGGGASSSSYSSSSSSGSSPSYSRSADYSGKGTDTRSSGLGVKPNVTKIEEQLENVMKRIQSVPRERKYPVGASPELRDLINAEHDETFLDAVSSMDRSDRKTAEKQFMELIKNAAGNKFKELYGWGGLMEIYQLEEYKEKFRHAFSEYVKKAQELKQFYGPLADSVASAYTMFDQLEKIDPGLLKQALTKHNLSNKTNLKYEDIMG
ncbi:hypothetical protein EOM81_09065, partial [bacterium]|nr:hypothetical protein [bacterium]